MSHLTLAPETSASTIPPPALAECKYTNCSVNSKLVEILFIDAIDHCLLGWAALGKIFKVSLYVSYI
jgi:hypothetical protein